MNPEDKLTELHDALILCEIHFQRMSYAFGKLKNFFPLTPDGFSQLTFDDLSYSDQLIFRFSKLQDSMGTKLFPSILESLGEDIRGIPFIDLLNNMEKLNLLDDQQEWFTLRETRNIVTHEYPFNNQDIMEGLNILSNQVIVLERIYTKLKDYIFSRFHVQPSITGITGG